MCMFHDLFTWSSLSDTDSDIRLSTGLTPHVHRKKGGGGDIYFFTYANVFVTTLTFI